MQIPYFARHGRVVTFDGRGNGRSDRPREPPAYERSEFAADALAVLDATRPSERSSSRSRWARSGRSLLAAEHPERVDGARLHRAGASGGRAAAGAQPSFRSSEELDTDEGWAKYNRHYWLRDYRGFLEFFISKMFTEPHSTKQIEDCVGWGLETMPRRSSPRS